MRKTLQRLATPLVAIALLTLSNPPASAGPTSSFPFPALGCLAVSVVLIAAAGVDIALLRSSLFILLGLAGLALFFRVDALKPRSRLFPS